MTDISAKFRRLGLTNKEKMTHFLQGLRPDPSACIHEEPKTFAEAEKAARFAESVARVPQSASTTGTVTNSSEQEVLVKLLNKRGA